MKEIMGTIAIYSPQTTLEFERIGEKVIDDKIKTFVDSP
jgi:hypothetical protein